MNFGERLKQLRQQRDWSQPELADAIGIEQSYLSKLENAKSIPSAEILERILESFQLSIDDFLQGIDDSEIRNHLRSIPLVNGHLLEQKETAHRRQRNWFIASAICCVLGITTLALGLFGMGTWTFVYDYGSEEIVPIGDNGESFQSLEVFLDSEFIEARTDLMDTDLDRRTRDETINLAYDALIAQYASLATPAYFATNDYRGQSFIEPVTEGQDLVNLQASNRELGGTRTFSLYNTRSVIREEFRYVNIGGIFLLALGIFGFILERLLARKD